MTWNTDIEALIEENPPEFHLKELIPLSVFEQGKLFHADSYAIVVKNVDLRDVVGIGRGYSIVTDFKTVLASLPRRVSNLSELSVRPEFYLQSNNGNSEWAFTEIDGMLFVEVGRHRSTILRYYAHYNPEMMPEGPIARGVKVYVKSVNQIKMDLRDALLEVLRQFPHLTLKESSVDANLGKWKLENTKLDKVFDIESNSDLLHYTDILQTTNLFKQLFGSQSHREIAKYSKSNLFELVAIGLMAFIGYYFS